MLKATRRSVTPWALPHAAGDQAPELGPAQQARLQHNLQLAARCARLETERRLLAEQKDTAEAAAAAAQAQLAVANQRLARVGAPQGLLLQQLQDSEERAALAEAQLRQLQVRGRRCWEVVVCVDGWVGW